MTIDKLSAQNGMMTGAPMRAPKDAGEGPAPAAEQKDEVSLSSGESLGKKLISLPGKAFKEVVGIAHGTVEAAIGAVPSALGGIESGLSVRRPDGQYEGHKGDADGGYGVGYVLQAGAAGAVAGGVMGGPWGVAIGGGAGIVAGLVKMGIDHETGAMKRVTGSIEDKTYGPILDNIPTGDKMYDAGKNISEGAIVGMKAGIKESFTTGREKGQGTMSGLWEGSKGFVRTLAHSSEEAPPAAPQEPKTLGEKFKDAALFVVGVPKEILKAVFGAAAGTVGAVLTTPNGLIEGVIQGAHHHGDASRINVDTKLHRALLKIETTLIGAAAGSIAGPLGTVGGAVAGALGGLLVGGVLSRIEHATETDKDIAKGIENSLKREMADNKDLGSPIANGHRNVIEGAMVGTAAGIREGFSTGYDAGAGFVQGVADSVVGVGKGLKGAFDALKNPAPPKPQAETEE
ncbi:MAG: hypothetical protein RDV48_02580 [Candidatus Eremiobacteraeota bacterium]|nr:hypothetical protein [Candidatus Eremiobacteraeota bacterium]